MPFAVSKYKKIADTGDLKGFTGFSVQYVSMKRVKFSSKSFAQLLSMHVCLPVFVCLSFHQHITDIFSFFCKRIEWNVIQGVIGIIPKWVDQGEVANRT